MRNEEEESTLPAGWAAERLSTLRQRLKMTGEWPERADLLWLDLAQHVPAKPDERDEALFSIVVGDALRGVDISRRYPNFYKKMLGNPALFQAFIETVEVMEEERAGNLEEVPTSVFKVPDPSEAPPLPEVKEPGGGRWSVIWRQTTERLERIFGLTGPSLAPAFRSERGLLEERSAAVIRGQATVAGQNLGVLLMAARTDDPDRLQLQLLVADLGWSHMGFSADSLQANVRWGHYNETGLVNEEGEVDFPPLFLEAVLDDSGRSLVGDLQLHLEPVEA